MQWLGEPVRGPAVQLTVVAAGDYPQAGNDKIQLWWIFAELAAGGPWHLAEPKWGECREITLPQALGERHDDSEFNLAVSSRTWMARRRPSIFLNGPGTERGSQPVAPDVAKDERSISTRTPWGLPRPGVF